MTAPDETPREHAIPPTRDHEPHCPPERTTMNAVTDVLTPPAIGQPFAGGIFAGHFFLAEQPYALVLSPKDHGEIEEIAWNKSRKRVADALSYADGLRNTEAMAAAVPPLDPPATLAGSAGLRTAPKYEFLLVMPNASS